ncbi:MAG: phosphotransferase [archaeon]|nr:phosphotransferase [Bacilli bacterium]MCQ2976437.1 phosphotransferase [archaeon]
MNISKDEFLLLRNLVEFNIHNQRSFADNTNFSLGKVNKLIKQLLEKQIICKINKRYVLSCLGKNYFKEFKVNNAIILAAGLSSRFVPISYDKPKALLVVDGLPLIEHIILKLKEKDINNIYIVIGYKSELFFYLKDKYGVNLIFNPEFNIKNTHASINVVKEHLANTYIVCGDNYFKENLFHQYEYESFYGSIFLKEKSFERGFILDKNDYVIDTNKPTLNQWVMWGHAYFDKNFSKEFVKLLNQYYGNPAIDNYYWETIYIENLDKLKMKAQKYSNDVIYEFDSINDLIAYDKNAFKTNNNFSLSLMCKVFNCPIESFSNFEQIKSGLSNRNFTFYCNDQKYVFRIPGANAGSYVDRKAEKKINSLANKVGVDESVIYFDEEGYKISKFIETTDLFDFNNEDHCKKLSAAIKKLHSVKSGYRFDFFENAEYLLKQIKNINSDIYFEASMLSRIAAKFNEELKNDKWATALCHNDLYEPNILISGDKLSLIDWEFSGDNDIGFDVSKLIAYKVLNKENIQKYLSLYFERNATDKEIRHIMLCAVINYYYWIIWTFYMMALGNNYQSYLNKWLEEFNKYVKFLEK